MSPQNDSDNENGIDIYIIYSSDEVLCEILGLSSLDGVTTVIDETAHHLMIKMNPPHSQ